MAVEIKVLLQLAPAYSAVEARTPVGGGSHNCPLPPPHHYLEQGSPKNFSPV